MLSPKLSFSLSAALRKAAEKGANSASCHGRHQRRQRVVGQQTGSELWTSISLLCTRCPPRHPSTLHGMQIVKEKKQKSSQSSPTAISPERGPSRDEMPRHTLHLQQDSKAQLCHDFSILLSALHNAQFPSSGATKH